MTELQLQTLHYTLRASGACTRIASRDASESAYIGPVYREGYAVLTDTMLSALVEAEQAASLEDHADVTRRITAMLRDNWEIRNGGNDSE